MSDPTPPSRLPLPSTRLASFACAGCLLAVAIGLAVAFPIAGEAGARAVFGAGVVVLCSALATLLAARRLGHVRLDVLPQLAIGMFSIRSLLALAGGAGLQIGAGLDPLAFWLTFVGASLAVLAGETFVLVRLLGLTRQGA